MSTPKTSLNDARVVPLHELLNLYELPHVSVHMLEGMEGNIFVFDEDAHFESLDLDKVFNSKGNCGALFRGDLRVDSYIIQPEMDYGPFVYVLGNVAAKNIFLGGGYIHLEGNVTAEQTFLAGFYNHGMATVTGMIDAELVMSFDHSFNFSFQNLKKGIFLSDNLPSEATPFDPAEVMAKGYWNKEDNYLLQDKVLKAVKTGKSILKADGGVSPIQKRLDKAKGSKAKRADLSKLNLKTLPREVFDFTDLQQLDLSSNPLTSIGRELAVLQQLRVLDLSNCEFEIVPDVLGQITSLEQVDLRSNAIALLPDSFSGLRNLKKLSLRDCQFETLPAIIKDLPQLEVLDLDYQRNGNPLSVNIDFSALKELTLYGRLDVPLPRLERLTLTQPTSIRTLPDSIIGCRNLKKLDIRAIKTLHELREDLTELQQLEEFAFFINNALENIQVLAKLPKLKAVHVKYSGDIIPEPFYQLLEIPQWTTLYIEGRIDDSSVVERILRRANLRKLVKVSSFAEEECNIEQERKWLGIQL